MEKEIWTIDDIIKDYEVKGLSGRSKIDFLNSIKRKVEFYDKLNETFGDAHICEIQKEFSKYDSLCEESKCDECPLGIGDSVCLKHTFEKKWELTPKPKKYLKWEDLEYDKKYTCVLNNIEYQISKRKCDEVRLINENGWLLVEAENKQFFDNLHLEVIE